MLSDSAAYPETRVDRDLVQVGNGAPAVQAAQGYSDPWYDGGKGDAGGIDLSRYWRILLKHRWMVLAIILMAMAFGVGASLLMTPIYRAETTLQIDRESARVVKVDSVEPADQAVAGDEFFQTQYGLLKSRALALEVVDTLGLAGDDQFIHAMGGKEPHGENGAAATQDQRRDIAVALFEHNFGVAPIRGSRLVNLSFESPNANLAARVVNAAADGYIATNIGRRLDQSSHAAKLLEDKLTQVKAKLEDSERQVVDYATSQQIINIPSGSQDTGAQGQANQSLAGVTLNQLNSSLSAAQADRIKAEQRWRQSQGPNGLALPEVQKNPTIQELLQTKAKAQAEYADKRRIYKADYPDMLQLQSRIAELDRQVQSAISNVQQSLKNDYDVALAQEQSFEKQVNGLKGSVLSLRQRSIQYDILQREADTNRTMYEGLLQRYKEIGVGGDVMTNNIFIIDRAEAPHKPFKPKPLINLFLATIAGVILAVLVAFLMELLDESIGTPEDVEAKLEIPLLGAVPKLERGKVPNAMLDDVRSAFAEAYYSVRTALQFSTINGAPRSLLVTSSRPSEGKSTTALAMAKNFARLGKTVLLVDGDLRNPSMHRNFQADNSKGISNLLTGNASLASVVVSTDIATLSFIPCGPLPPNPAELLASNAVSLFLEDALQTYDMVIVDGPPILGLADAPLLGAIIAGTVFVLEAGGTRRGSARVALRRLRAGRANILGCVLTKFNAKKTSYGYGAGYAYAYDYTYGETPKLKKS